jgi:TolA-binding protein
MSPTSELHPEEMLDAARRGTLSASAKADLDAHLQRCPACRMQLAMTADAADAELSASQPNAEDAEMLARMVKLTTSEAQTLPSRSQGGRKLRRLAFAGLYLAIGSGVASAMWSLHDRARSAAPQPEPGAEAANRTKTKAVHAPAASGPLEPAAEVPTLEPAPVPTPAKPAPRTPARRAPAPVAETDGKNAEAILPAEDRAHKAGALFAQANLRRRQGDEVGALAQYQELIRSYPGSREALTSSVIAGQLSLDRGDPAAAVVEFRGYLAALPSGTLAEEARWGMAQALMRLHRPEDERRAWEELLLRHPSSIHAPRARARLTELRGPSAP